MNEKKIYKLATALDLIHTDEQFEVMNNTFRKNNSTILTYLLELSPCKYFYDNSNLESLYYELFEKSIGFSKDLDETCPHGLFPIFVATLSNDTRALSRLIQCGANVNQRQIPKAHEEGKESISSLRIAVLCAKDEATLILLDNGAIEDDWDKLINYNIINEVVRSHLINKKLSIKFGSNQTTEKSTPRRRF